MNINSSTQSRHRHSGLHLMANLHGVTHVAEMASLEGCRTLCKNAVAEAKLTIVGDFFHQFEVADGVIGGLTGVVVLAESHLAIHTWPESAYVTLDVFVCNYNQDNSNNARALFESLITHFQATEVNRFETERG